MVASYPGSTRAYVRREDRVDINDAADINDLQEEIVAIQETLGSNPQVSARVRATTVGERLTVLEDDLFPRVEALEQRLRRATVTANRASTAQVNSSPNWQSLVMPSTVAALNDFGTTEQLYNGATGRFFSVAAAPALWTFTATITWLHPGAVSGVRGLALVTSAGAVLTMNKQSALAEDQPLAISWTGALPADPNFYLSLQVKQTQGTALFLAADEALTPHHASFTHIPG